MRQLQANTHMKPQMLLLYNYVHDLQCKLVYSYIWLVFHSYCIRKKFRSGKVSQISQMTIQLRNFSSETSATNLHVQSVKGFTTKLFLRIFLNLVIYKTFRFLFETFYVYGTLYNIPVIRQLCVAIYHKLLCKNMKRIRNMDNEVA